MTKLSNDRQPQKSRNYDDGAVLTMLSQMLNDNPSMKPVAAIKAMGITDQPSIKRLREKFHAEARGGKQSRTSVARGKVITFPANDQASAPALDGGGAIFESEAVQAASRPVAHPASESLQTPTIAAVEAEDVLNRVSADPPVVAEAAQSARQEASAVPEAGADPWFITLGAVSVSAWLSVFELQQVMMRETLRVLPITTALRSQMALCQWTMMAYGSQARPRNCNT